MEAGAVPVELPGASAAPAASTGRKVGALFVATGLALFALMGVLGLVMRLSQAEIAVVSPSWFYRVMTLHGAGMLVGALLAQMGALWYVLRGHVALDARRALASYLSVVAGAVLVLLATLAGGFATGWTFLWPLPFHSQGAWKTWPTAFFLAGLVLVGAGFQIYCIDVLAKIAGRYGSIGRSLGIPFLRGRDEHPPPPQVIGATVVALDGLLASAAGVTVLAALIGRLIDSRIEIDALWAKNVTYFFGHSYANLIIYLAVGAVYVLLPRFTGRPWKTTRPIVVGWLATLTFVATAYSHHLYMDFVQPAALQGISFFSSSAAAVPVLVVTIFTGMMLVWGSRYRWTLASTLLYLGFAGWAIGGAGAVLDSLIPVNFRLHNTLWVPAHFHTYLLLGVMFWAMALGAHFLEAAAGRPARAAYRVLAPALMLLGGYGLVGVWYVSGALGAPRRYAVQPFGMEGWSVGGSVFALVFAAGFLVLLAAYADLALLSRKRRPRRPGDELGDEGEEPPAPPRLAGERPLRTAGELALAAAVATVAFVSLLPPIVDAAQAAVRWHHLAHAAMFLAGAAAALAVVSVSEVWARLGERFATAGLGLAILAPVVSLLAMTPRFYGGLDGRPALHFGYHLLFVGLGALTGLGAARLGRSAAWVLTVLASGAGVLYAAGVLGG